ncbi:hypothetical protein AAIB33_10590 [Microbacterium sp. AZCO]|uniref:hypothetical protein n=1 Tax=Microbacterium sp. AZCO TaxID=3142976 RepID=UPI0031F35B62
MNHTKIPQFTIPGWLQVHVAEVRAWPAVRGADRPCVVAVCDHSAFSLGLCREHYDTLRGRARRRGMSLAAWVAENEDEVHGASRVHSSAPGCWVAACGRSAVRNGLCHAHAVAARRRFRQLPAEQLRLVPASDRATPTTTPEEANHE